MDVERIATSTQEQAVAAWIDYLNQERLNELIFKLISEEGNLDRALKELAWGKEEISKIIVSNRGGTDGLHGYIAEAAEVSIENARKLVEGIIKNAEENCKWINDNGPVDINRVGIAIQQKFVRTGGMFSLNAVKEHLEKYPDFIKNGGRYQIPKDFYNQIQKALSLSEEEGKKLTRNSVPTKAQWEKIVSFFDNNEISMEDIEPAELSYASVQVGKIGETLDAEEKEITAISQKRRDEAYNASKPTWKEAGKAVGASAAIEGGMAFCLGYVNKRKSGKKAADFTAEDWKEICIDTGTGTAKGAIRGGTVYAMTNFTATPACVASSLVTAAFGVIAQAKAHSEGKISDEDFLINSEAVCLDVTVSAIASGLGQVLIPIPVLGAIVGNVAGTFAYELAKEAGLAKEQKLIGKNQTDIQLLDAKLAKQYAELVRVLKAHFDAFDNLIAYAFDPDVNASFIASVEFARFNGVPEDRILKSKEDIDSFFMS